MKITGFIVWSLFALFVSEAAHVESRYEYCMKDTNFCRREYQSYLDQCKGLTCDKLTHCLCDILCRKWAGWRFLLINSNDNIKIGWIKILILLFNLAFINIYYYDRSNFKFLMHHFQEGSRIKQAKILVKY